jgi:Ca-activated chloride channel family protein
MGPWLVLALLALAPLAFRRGWVAALGVLLIFGASATSDPAMAASGDWFARADQQGAASFEAGRHEEAAARFEDPEWQGAAAYRAGDFGAAAETLVAVASERGRYNLGNAFAQAGDLQNAIAAYDEVLAADPGHEDARHNRDLVQALLDQQEQAEQPSEDSGGGDDSESGRSGEQPQTEGSEDGEADGSAQPQASEGAEKGAESGASGTDPAEAESADGGDESGDGSGGGSGGEESAEGAQASDAAGAGDDAAERESEQAAGDSGTADSDPRSGEDSRPGAEEPAAQDASRSGATASSRADAPPGEGDASRDVQAGRGHEGGEPGGAPVASPGSPMTERDQELEHMLSRVPDDPGGLLREKLRRRYAEKHGLPTAGRGGR